MYGCVGSMHGNNFVKKTVKTSTNKYENVKNRLSTTTATNGGGGGGGGVYFFFHALT